MSGSVDRGSSGPIREPVHEHHSVLSSTQDRLRALAEGGAPFGSSVRADAQTAGRGRGGKSWASPAGCGLWMSVLLPGPGREGLAGLPLAIGTRLVLALEDRYGGRLSIKWPNDIHLPAPGGRVPPKVAGILCESAPGGGIAVGIGINLWRPPMESGSASGMLASTPTEAGPPGHSGFLEDWAGSPLSRREVASIVLEALDPGSDGRGLRLDRDLHGELVRRDLLRGRRVVPDSGAPGRAAGIRNDGALIVETDGGERQSIWSGGIRMIGGRDPSESGDAAGREGTCSL